MPPGTTTMPLSDIMQPFLVSASRSYPSETPDLTLTSLSMIARRTLAPGSILTSLNIIDSSTKASLSTTTPGERIEFHTTPPLIMQPSATIESGDLPPKTNLVGGSDLS